ncbi:polysaccharide biosynthesis protein [Devosia salina]|uniref:Polysaccharide biosynthesis protein n=1 Tax=Devosia salina TaxID=2860336 RepID=A0ABX8WIC3_9HYPH|nr:nucleoside-diphosphate sugar epimerase/dehydratase [Devosia salina]QYO77764.1 polysaccharide biosynthesis protein [Devosia salina]
MIRHYILNIPRAWKRGLLVVFDFAVLSTALWLSFALRLDQWALPKTSFDLMKIFLAPLLAIPIFVRMGLYRAVLRYLPERALWKILQAITLSVVLWVLAAFLLQMTGNGTVPRSVPVIYWALSTTVIIGSRLAAKRLLWPNAKSNSPNSSAIVIYGAGQAGTQLAQSLVSSHFIVGFLDDDTHLQYRELLGIRVFPPSHLPTLIRDFGVKKVILSMPTLSVARRKEIVANLSGMGVTVQSLPGLTDLVTGKYLVSQVKEIQIDDLLGRSSVPPDMALLKKMVAGRTIMVSGAGGSIGSELCRKIASLHPQRLVTLDANEFALYQIDRELSGTPGLSTVPVLGSVINKRLVDQVMQENSVDVVFHAAAYKHVPLVEANALEGIENNVFGTLSILDASLHCGVQDFVLISSDKAVRPTNVMGATKRWAELLVRQKAAEALKSDLNRHFCTVRFGNVLGSNGSVVPLFKEQIAAGGPITLTDSAMTRYFMSIQEAAELIVQAGGMSKGGDIFLLDMGEPILIAELAENMVRLAGMTVRNEGNPDGEIQIIATGKRPGEKLYEELFYDPSRAETTSHPKILKVDAALYLALPERLRELRDALDQKDERAARRILFDAINAAEEQPSR